MIRAVQLLDDFAIGGVTKALGVFEEPELAGILQSRTVPVAASDRLAPKMDADLIVLHMPPSWRRMPWLASLRIRNPSARIVHVEHSYTQAFTERNVSNPRRFGMMLRAAFALVDEIVCVSHAQRHWLVKASGTPASKFRTIYPWSGREELATIAAARPELSGQLKLAAYGRISKVKNFGPLVEAVRVLGPDICSLALGGTGPLEDELVRKAEGADNVSFVGMVEDVGSFLAQADAVIVPSLHESFGLVAIEARLAGRPILVADVDGLPEQATSGGYCAACETAEQIAEAIITFRSKPLDRMAIAARRGAIGHRDEVIAGWQQLLGAR